MMKKRKDEQEVGVDARTHGDEVIHIPLGDIVIGNRHRKDMGDLDRLAESMKTHGP